MKSKLLIYLLSLFVIQNVNSQIIENQDNQTEDPIVQRLLDDLSSNGDDSVIDPVRKAIIDSIFAPPKTNAIPTSTVSIPKVRIPKFRGCGFRNVGGIESGLPNPNVRKSIETSHLRNFLTSVGNIVKRENSMVQISFSTTKPDLVSFHGWW